jgi:predicted dehydrogenase
MTVRVGVIGVGLIGEDHVRRLSSVVAGATVTAVTDVDASRAAAVAKLYGVPAVHVSGEDVIADPAVDAVVVRASRCSARSRWPRRRKRANGSWRPRLLSGGG